MTNEAFSRVKIEAQLRDQDWATAIDAGTRTEFEQLFEKEGDPTTVDPSALERRFMIPERNRAGGTVTRLPLNGNGRKWGEMPRK